MTTRWGSWRHLEGYGVGHDSLCLCGGEDKGTATVKPRFGTGLLLLFPAHSHKQISFSLYAVESLCALRLHVVSSGVIVLIHTSIVKLLI